MITGAQIRMSRGHLKWSARTLADEAGVAESTIKRMEAEDGVPTSSGQNLDKVRGCLETQGITFLREGEDAIGPGVAIKAE